MCDTPTQQYLIVNSHRKGCLGQDNDLLKKGLGGSLCMFLASGRRHRNDMRGGEMSRRGSVGYQCSESGNY